MNRVSGFLVFSLVLLAQAALGDTVSAYGELRCEGGLSVIRFASAVNDDLPSFPDVPVELGLELPSQVIDGNSCELADWQEIKVKVGERARRPFGECGGALDAFASLWIGGQKVLSRMWVVRSCFPEAFHYDVIAYQDGRLTLCRTEASLPERARPENGVGCRDATAMLEAAEHDWFEYPPHGAAEAPLGVIQVTQTEDHAFCRGFIDPAPGGRMALEARLPGNGLERFHRQGAMSPSARRAEARNDGWPTSEAFVVPMASSRKGRFEALDPGADSIERENGFSMAWLDFDNDAIKELVVRQSGTSGRFYGQKFYVARDFAAERILRAVAGVRADKSDASWQEFYGSLGHDNVLTWIDARNPPATGYSDRYTFQEVLETELGMLVFAAPFGGRVRPTGLIYRPLASGASELVCVFQRIEENF